MKIQKPQKRVQFLRRSHMIMVGLLFFVLTCLWLRPQQSFAATSILNFQARLMANNGAIVPDGNYNVEFKLYNASTSTGSTQGSCTGDANCLWVETRTNANQVRVANGYLTVNLGSVAALPNIDWSQNLWLGMNVGGTAVSPTWDGEMTPRLQLTATPYAFNAGQLGGISASGFIQNTTSVQAANINVQAASSGSVATTLQANASGAGDILDLKNGSGVNVATFGSTGAVLLQNSTNSTTAFQIRPNGSSIDVLDVDTTNSSIGIGNNAPAATLDVGPATLGSSQIIQIRVGDVLLQSQQGNSNGITASTTRGSNGNLTVDGASGSAVYLSPFTTNNNFLAAGGGKVLIGGQDTPTATLSFENGANQSINIITASSGAGNTLSLQGGGAASGNNAGGGLTLQGGGATGTATGGLVTLQGGNGGTGAAALGGNVLIQGGTASGTGASNGGNITLQGGTAAGTGTKGLITINGGFIYTTVAYSSAVTATITQSSVDSYTTILATATATNLVFTVPSPTITTSGRMLNITNVGTNSFTLVAGSISYILSGGNTAVLVWSGSAWTSAGASSLQAAYGLSTGGTNTTPTIKLINGIGDINIQDADGSLGGGNFLSLRGPNSSGLGSVIFGFGIKGQFFEQPSTDTATALQVENHAGNTLFAIDSSSGYINLGSTGGSTGGTGSAFNGTTTNIETSPNANTATNIGSTAQNSGTATINIGYTNTTGGGSIVNIGSGSGASSGTTTIQANGALTLSGGSIGVTTGTFNAYGGSINVNGVANPAAPTLTSSATGGSLAANTYNYRIDAIGADGSSTTASIASSPGSVTTSGTTSKNTLSWSAVSNATGYHIYRSINGGNTWFVNQVSSATTSIIDNGTTYTWGTGGSVSNISNAGGINLQKSTGITFDAGSGGTYQMEIFDNVNGNNTLTVGNYNSGGSVDIQASNFYISDTSTFNHDFSLTSTGAVTFKSSTASLSSAFVIQNSTGVNMFNVNTSTTAEAITIGPAGGDSVGEILILGTKTGSSADPTWVADGAMYYNATSRSFRCTTNGVWRSCMGGLVNSSTAASNAVAATVTKTNFSGGTNNSYSMLANDCQPGVVYNITAQGIYSNSITASTLTFALTIDGTATNLVASGAIPTVASASNAGWQVSGQIICDTTGTSGTVEAQGTAMVSSNTASAGTSAATGLMANSATQTFNTTTSHTLALAVTWGANTSGNTATMRQFIVQRIGP